MATFDQCESQSQNLLNIYNSNGDIVESRCVQPGSQENPTIITDIILPQGTYKAELFHARNVNEIEKGQSPIITTYNFVVEKLPAISYQNRVEKRNIDGTDRYVNVVTYRVDGKIIDKMYFNDGIPENTIPVTSSRFDVVYTQSTPVTANFIINPVTIENIRFTTLPPQPEGPYGNGYYIITLNVQLVDLTKPYLVKRINSSGSLEPVYNIDYASNIFILNSNGSIGNYLEIITHDNEGNDIIWPNQQFGIAQVDIPCDGNIYSLPYIKVSAVMWDEDTQSYLYDSLELTNILGNGSCNGQYPGDDAVYELKIRKKDNESGISMPSDKAGYTEYITQELLGGHQRIDDNTYTSGNWDTKFPFNRIRPCWVRDDGFVEAYFQKDDLNIVEEWTNGTNLANTNRDYLHRTDGNIMVEFPNVYYNYYDLDDDWLIIQISSKRKLDHWIPTNIKTYDTQPISGSYTDNGDGTYTVVHDTIYLGMFYSKKVSRTIDGKIYEYFNSNILSGNHFSNNEDPLDADEYISGINNIGKGYDVFSIQNLILIKLLQVFRFCSTDNLVIPNLAATSESRLSITKDADAHPYNYQKRFACLDYPFGFGVSTTPENINWESTDGFKSGTVYMPAVLGAYYQGDGISSTSTNTSLQVSTKDTDIPTSIPISNYHTLDDNLGRHILYEKLGNIARPHELGSIDEYNSASGWVKPSPTLFSVENNDVIPPGEILPLFVSPFYKSTTAFEASYGL